MQIECLENEIEWQIGCAWPKSSKLNAHKMNLVDKITKWPGKPILKQYYIVKKNYSTLLCIWVASKIL